MTQDNEPLDAGEWQEHHIPDSSIRTAIITHFQELGYEVFPRSLRIYGYGQPIKELESFQGHIKIHPKPSNKNAP